MEHNWVHDGHQKDLYKTDGEGHLCSADCGKPETHQYYIVCGAPAMIYKMKKCMRDLEKIWKQTKTASPIASALRHILTCTMNESTPLYKSLHPSPIQDLVNQAWMEQQEICWGQLLKGRLSSKWGKAQDIYYRDNPDTKNCKYYNATLLAAKVVGKFIEMSLDLWDARNKILHGYTLGEQNRLKRVRAIQQVTLKYEEGYTSMKNISHVSSKNHARLCVTNLHCS